MQTIFIGGGTPTLLEVGLWKQLLSTLGPWLASDGTTEFTVEANPETVTDELAHTLAAGGVNRVSIGAQSFDERHLKTLERWHAIESVVSAVERFRAAGISNINLDLIFGIPGQSVADWQRDLERVEALHPMHVSCYGLTYEPDTAMTARLNAGLVERADEDAEADMFEVTRTALREMGFDAYEVSNFSRPGFECQHNLMYWQGGDYLAAGPSASGHVDGVRWKNAAHLGAYLAATDEVPVEHLEVLDDATRLGERIMLGLRLTNGLDMDALLSQASAIDEQTAGNLRTAITQQQRDGMVAVEHGRARLTDAGLMLGDRVISSLMACCARCAS